MTYRAILTCDAWGVPVASFPLDSSSFSGAYSEIQHFLELVPARLLAVQRQTPNGWLTTYGPGFDPKLPVFPYSYFFHPSDFIK